MLRLRAKKVLADIQTSRERPSSPDADAMSEPSTCSSWGGRGGSRDGTEGESSYLLIHVHEARNLVAKDYETNSSDPFVQVTLGSSSKKTRAIRRNCHPLWEQPLLFPLDGVSEEEPLSVKVFQTQQLSKAKQFLGQVFMTLGKAIEIAQEASLGQNYWFGLSKQHSTDIVGGELCLGFRVLDALSYVNMVSELEGQMDSDHIAQLLSSKALRVQLKGINGLQASGLMNNVRSQAAASRQQQLGPGKRGTPAKGLSLFIKFGRLTMEKPLPELPAESDDANDDPDAFELDVNEEVVIPLAAAVRAPPPLTARRKDELFDVKLYIKSGNTTIAKTQIPIWDVPNNTDFPSSSAAAAADSAATPTAAATTATGGAANGTQDGPASIRTTQNAAANLPTGKLLVERAASLALGSLKTSSSDSLGSESAPTTPRRRLSMCAGALGVFASPSGPLSPPPPPPAAATVPATEESIMRSSKSEAQLTRLANMPASGSNSAKDLFVEGSLCSVTASRTVAQHHTAMGLGKRKVQGLAELSFMSDRTAFKAAVKNILVPPREVSRMGWVPTRASQCDCGAEVNAQADLGMKHYCRLMEAYVPMHAHLEIGLALEVLPQVQPVAQSAAVGTTDGTVDCTDDSYDSEDVSDATPIALPEAYDLVLQDEVLHIGVNSLHALLLGSGSEFMAAHYSSEGLLDVVVGPWKAAADPDCLRARQASYIKKLNIPFAPKQCHVWEEHRILVKQDGGFVVQVVCTNDAPKGDCFRALIQMCGVFVSSGKSRLRISMKLDWHKNTLGKSLVQSGAESDAKRGWARLVAPLKQHIAGNRGLPLADASAPTALTDAAAPGDGSSSSVSAAASNLSMSKRLSRLVGASPLAAAVMTGWLLLLIAVLLLVLVVVVHAGVRSVSGELHGLTVVLEALANAQCVGVGPDGMYPDTYHLRLLTAQ